MTYECDASNLEKYAVIIFTIYFDCNFKYSEDKLASFPKSPFLMAAQTSMWAVGRVGYFQSII